MQIDAGTQALDIVRERAARFQQVKKILSRILMAVVATVVLAVTGAGYFIYKTTYVTGRAEDARPCKLDIGGDTYITGKRLYTYKFHEIFGYRFIDTRTVETKTFVDVHGRSMLVVGHNHNNTSMWQVAIGAGIIGQQQIKSADVITFVLGDGTKAIAVSGKGFCK